MCPGRKQGVAAQPLPKPEKGEYDIFTPPPEEAISEQSPDRLLNFPGAEDVWDDGGATHTEYTVECMGSFAAQLYKVKDADKLGVKIISEVE